MSYSILQDTPPSSHSKPEWLREAQSRAAALYESLPSPARTDESWRFANIKAFDPQDFSHAMSVATEVAHDLLSLSRGVEKAAGSFVFANDQLIGRTNPGSGPLAGSGVIWLPLEEALHSHSDLVAPYFMQSESIFDSKKFMALHQASVRAGTFLYIPKGVRIEAPLQSFHWLAGSGQSVFPHTLIVAEEGSAVTFVDWFKSANDAKNLACGVNDLHVGEGAEVRYVSVQDWSRQTVAFHSNTTTVAAGGSALNLGLHLGCSFERGESLSRLNGKGARSEMLAATVADGSQEFDQRTLQDHRSPDTYSDLLYKNALYDTARTTVAGLIRVEPHAHRTDAYQKVRNLVLSADAEANSLPGLEILADQVRCSHGATTGEINPEELFYMQSRGISENDAFRLITFGFLNETLDRLPEGNLRASLQATLHARLLGH